MKPNWREILRRAAAQGSAHAWRILVLECEQAVQERDLDEVRDVFEIEFFVALDELVLWEDVDA